MIRGSFGPSQELAKVVRRRRRERRVFERVRALFAWTFGIATTRLL
jgi:hypothetical protein